MMDSMREAAMVQTGSIALILYTFLTMVDSLHQNPTRLYGVTTQRRVIFILASVNTHNLTPICRTLPTA
jgi:hypothetical protein